MWIKSNFFKYSFAFLVVISIIYMLGKIDFFIAPFKKFIAVLFFPILLSLALYHLFRPLVRQFEKFKMTKALSILASFLLFFIFLSIVITYAGSIVVAEGTALYKDFPQMIDMAKEKTNSFKNWAILVEPYRGRIEEQLTSFMQNIIPSLSSSIFSGVSNAIYAITNIASILIVVPFILFYLLKDDIVFFQNIKNRIPKVYKNDIVEIFKETDKTLSTYITGQAMIALILGILTYIGYLIIGLKYAFILAFFVCITSFIPMFGVILGIIPALLVALSINPIMLIKIIIVCIIVQQLEGNFISPHIIGKRLAIHPLTIIIIFLAAASLYGFIGMLIAIPAYAVIKVLISGAWKIFKISRGSSSSLIQQ